ncbi:hypothetical protein XENOCAPTIV_003403 [Xenoophorus captivus]|uniref:Uncharacterized protein n=1 Tax=Xenoophorus captivus TaxID=1517983 RepID=A0ABV0SE05_9TELE
MPESHQDLWKQPGHRTSGSVQCLAETSTELNIGFNFVFLMSNYWLVGFLLLTLFLQLPLTCVTRNLVRRSGVSNMQSRLTMPWWLTPERSGLPAGEEVDELILISICCCDGINTCTHMESCTYIQAGGYIILLRLCNLILGQNLRDAD